MNNNRLNEEFELLVARLHLMPPNLQMRWNAFEEVYGFMPRSKKAKLLRTFLQVCEAEFTQDLYNTRFWEN